jgi:hypothetical protein
VTAGAELEDEPVVRVVHHVPGRLRLRLARDVVGDAAAAAVGNIPGVIESRWSPLTGGLLVRFRPGDVEASSIMAAVLGGVAPGVTPTSPHLPESQVSVHDTVRTAFADVDRGLRRASYGHVGLGGLVVAATAGWGILELLRRRVTPLAWSSALWYAHGLYRDYLAEARPTAATDEPHEGPHAV